MCASRRQSVLAANSVALRYSDDFDSARYAPEGGCATRKVSAIPPAIAD